MQDAEIAYLFTAKAIRERCQKVTALVASGQGQAFKLHRERLPKVAAYVWQVIGDNYPSLEVPYHSRIRHLQAGGVDRVHLEKIDLEGAKRLYDLIIVSILLDAGAGPDWSYLEGARRFNRSEGLAVASYHMFQSGLFSGAKEPSPSTTALGLKNLTAAAIAQGMQVSPQNPLVGLEGRVALLQRLGAAIIAQPEVFPDGRLGQLVDYFLSKAENGKLAAADLLAEVLGIFRSIWPPRLQRNGIELGDTWSYPGLEKSAENDLVPFHKLSQWLTYSLFEPLEILGMEITGIDAMTGLPEYRNGGLLVDSGLISLKEPARPLYEPGDALIVEWRALTVCLLDDIAAELRRTHPEAAHWPLAKFLEGGTWAAGRQIARTLRPGGGPPFNIISDGTIF